MPPAKMQDISLPEGLTVKMTTSQRDHLKALIVELNKLKTLKEAILRLEKETDHYIEKDFKQQKGLTKDQKDRMHAIQDMHKMIITHLRDPAVKQANVQKQFNKAMNLTGDQQWQKLGMKPVEKGIDWMGGKKATFEVEERIKELEIEAEAQDRLRKKSSWQLVLWGTVGSVWKMMTDNSKILSHYIQVIGAGFGFILDMIIINLMPIIIPFVKKLFEIGEWFQKAPDWVKAVSTAVATFFLLGGGVLLLTLKGILDKIIAIGVEAAISKLGLEKLLGMKTPTTTTPTPVPTGTAAGGGLPWYAGILSAITPALASIGGQYFPMLAAAMISNSTEYDKNRPTESEYQKSKRFSWYSTADERDASKNVAVNVYIGDQALDKSQFQYNKAGAQRSGITPTG